MNTGTLIMAGGRGERFWPASRRDQPKQFHSFGMQEPLIAQAVHRLEALTPPARQLIITSRALVPQTAQLLPELGENQIIGEPVGRNTAPCIGVAAVWMAHHWGKDCVMIVQTADHYIKRPEEFLDCLRTGIQAASQEYLVTIGLEPDRPETGYGYLELDEPIDPEAGLYRVRRFLEKPDKATAEKFFQGGNHLWNGGMFLWTCERILEEIEKHLPRLFDLLQRYAKALGAPDSTKVLEEIYPQFPNISIDYGIMEKAGRVATVRADIGWDDLGNWAVMERLHKKDGQGNVVSGPHLGVETRDCIISADSGLVATFGIQNLIVVKEADRVLVMPRDRAADLKELIQKIKEDPEKKEFL
jgi:mannose-1-phosphate guanylyltransferase